MQVSLNQRLRTQTSRARFGSHREEVRREMSDLRGHSLIEKTGRRLLVRVRAVENLVQRERLGCK